MKSLPWFAAPRRPRRSFRALAALAAFLLPAASPGMASAQVVNAEPPASVALKNMVFYASQGGSARFTSVLDLSDGSILVGGTRAADAVIAPANVPRTTLAGTEGIKNALGAPGQVGFLLHLTRDLQHVLRVVEFPPGAVEDVHAIKTTTMPGRLTGVLYISGITRDSKANNGGYFIARLDKNFVKGAYPTRLAWVRNIWATWDHQTRHAWDVGGDGKVVYTTGEPFGANWCAVGRLRADGTDDVVENWRYHGGVNGSGTYAEGEWTPASGKPGVTPTKSFIVFKTTNRIQLRSWTQADYDAVLPDGNGATKKGRWPLDYFFSGPGNPQNSASSPGGPGYTGYRLGGAATQRIGGVAVDRRNNHVYIGFSVQSRLPDGNPDFEPAVLALDASGGLKWWSRLYQETTSNSTPDQYVDGLAIDPVGGNLAVLARCHGNNAINLWQGNAIAAFPSATSFHNQFTGNQGNIHISWAGKLSLATGTLQSATYVADYEANMTGTGASYADPNLDGWPSHNAGWPNLNTTRCETDVRVDALGRVCLLGVGRRPITTAKAYQKMPKLAEGVSAWSHWARVFSPRFETLTYSTLLTGAWDQTTGANGDNTELLGICPTRDGLFVVGYQEAAGANVPVTAVPGWGHSAPTGETALIARFRY